MSNKVWRKVHDFKESLAVGHAGEASFMLLMPGLTRLDGRKNDFVIEATGETVELKTDSYCMTNTSNFFMERWSSWADQKPGGPWQSKSTYYVYYFKQNNTAFVFKTDELRAFLETQTFRGITIPNKGWTTVGFKVPRELLKHLYTVLKKD